MEFKRNYTWSKEKLNKENIISLSLLSDNEVKESDIITRDERLVIKN